MNLPNEKPLIESPKADPYRKPVKIGKYDSNLPHRQSKHSEHVTVGALKAERLVVRNERRAANGLPPITNYAQV